MYPAVFHKSRQCLSALIYCKALHIAQLLTGRCVEFTPTEEESILLIFSIISLFNLVLQSAVALVFIAYMVKQLLRHRKTDILQTLASCLFHHVIQSLATINFVIVVVHVLKDQLNILGNTHIRFLSMSKNKTRLKRYLAQLSMKIGNKERQLKFSQNPQKCNNTLNTTSKALQLQKGSVWGLSIGSRVH